jgi:hypothetical protein
VPFTSLRWKTISILAAQQASQIPQSHEEFFKDTLLAGLEDAEITRLASSAVNVQIRGWAQQQLLTPHRMLARGKIDVNNSIKTAVRLREVWHHNPFLQAQYPNWSAYIRAWENQDYSNFAV